MKHEIKKISFEEILPVWSNDLWPNRTSPIEPNSAMCYKEGYDMENMRTTPTFFGYYVDGELAGVNSGHLCKDSHYRSRGLFVYEKFRGMGIGTKLLRATIEQGRIENAILCWSFPRNTSWMTYHHAGFILTSEFMPNETGNNAYCVYHY